MEASISAIRRRGRAAKRSSTRPGELPSGLGDLFAFLAENRYAHVRVLAGKVVALQSFNYTTGLVVGLDFGGYEVRYCYEVADDAMAALELWDGTGHPSGPWIKCKGAGVDLLNPSFGVEDHDR